MRFLGFIILVTGAAAAALIAGSFLVLDRLNFFDEFEVAHAGSCTPVVGVPGVEDIAADETLSIAWLSSMDRRAAREEPGIRGAIIAFDPDNPLDTSSWRDRTGGNPELFEPLGIDLYEDENIRRLFVVNHAGRSVLIYDISEFGDLTLALTLQDERLTNPNSVVATGPETFYVTNSSRERRSGLLTDLKFALGLGSGSVLHYDGNSWSNAASDLKTANGIEISVDGRALFVAETADKSLSVFDRDPETGVILRSRKILLDGFPDNLNRTADNILLVGLIPKPLAFAGHTSDAEKASPSQIARIELSETSQMNPEMLFEDNGSRLSGATSATFIGRKLLIGAYTENKFLLCN